MAGTGIRQGWQQGAVGRQGHHAERRLSRCLHVDRHCIQTGKQSPETRTSGKLQMFPLAPRERRHGLRRHSPPAQRSVSLAARVRGHSVVEGHIA